MPHDDVNSPQRERIDAASNCCSIGWSLRVAIPRPLLGRADEVIE